MRIRELFRRRQSDAELDEEIRYHLDREIERNRASGMTPDAARRQALRDFGGVAQLQEECRETRGTRWLEAAAQDFRYGLRLMRRSPGFSAAAVLTIALGIGASTSIFSVVYGVALQPLPYRDPQRLVSIWSTTADMPRTFVGAANWTDWRKQNSTLEDIALTRHVANYNLTGDGEPERLMGARVTANLFDVLGVQPAIGRAFTAESERVEAAAYLVLLSDRLWRRRFGADPAIVGRPIQLNGRPYTVLGVMPPQFRYPTGEFEMWAPLYLPPASRTSRYDYSYLAVSRLKQGVTLAQAQADLDAISSRLAATYQENRGVRAAMQPMLADVVAPVKTALYALLGAVGCLLLIGTVNVANLFLARGLARERDRALRTALGASRGRLAVQAVLEAVPVVAAGAALGIVAAFASLQALVSLLPATMPRVEEIRIDGAVLAFTAALVAATAVLVALWPAFQAANLRGRISGRGREALVVAEVALTVMLVTGSVLLVRSFAQIRAVHPGFQADGALSMHLALSRAKYPEDRDIAAFAARLVERVRSIPGVTAAGMVNRLPIIGGVQTMPFEAEGIAPPAGGLGNADSRAVTPGYLRAMGIPLVEGRDLNDFDTESSRPVAVIDATTARKVWPNQSAVGKRLRIPLPGYPWIEIVGVAGSIRNDGLDASVKATVYWPHRQHSQDRMALVVRTAGDPSQWMSRTIAAIREVDPEQPVYHAFPMPEIVDRSLAQRRLNAMLVGSFGALSLLLAAIGIYGVMSFAVERRTREFGIRMALGAGAGDVIGSVVWRGLALGAAGSAIGLAGVGALAGFLRSLLFQVSATDWLSYAAAAAALLLVALAASYVPVRRAVRRDPMKSLRAE